MDNRKNRDVKTEALVLRRVNFGETDRILTIITPEGKKSVLAKGVRREKSKLASGVEIFCLSEVVLHFGHGELAVLTAAKPKKFYRNILSDLKVLEIASEMVKKVAKAAEAADNPEYFTLIRNSLEAIDCGARAELVLTWFYFNLVRISGEQINLYFDGDGEKLQADKIYQWDWTEKALKKEPRGEISANEIKMMRLMLSADIKLILRVKEADAMVEKLLYIAKTLNQL